MHLSKGWIGAQHTGPRGVDNAGTGGQGGLRRQGEGGVAKW